MLIRRLFPAVIVLTALAACQTTGSNTTNQTPTTPRSSFVNACADNAVEWRMTPNQAAGVCACAYDKVSSRYGHNWIRQPANPNTPLSRYFISSVRQCAARPNANANPNRRSIASHRSAFLDLCTSRNIGPPPKPAASAPVPTTPCAAATPPPNGSSISTTTPTPTAIPCSTAA